MVELEANVRTELGRRVKPLRVKGVLPAVIYGEKVPSQAISVSLKDFERVYRKAGESTLVTLKVDGTPYNVLIHSIASDPLKGSPIHADFYAVRMDKVIHAHVPLVFTGESPAVKNDGGVLIKVVQEVEVAALPQDLPHELIVDISSLVTFENRAMIRDILLPDGVKIVEEAGEVVALVEPPRTEEELTELKEAPTAEAPAEVKTEQEVKKEKKKEAAAAEEPAEGEKKSAPAS